MNIGRQYYPIGVDPTASTVVAILKRVGVAWKTGAKLIYGVVQNQGSAAFTFSAAQSDDNGVADAYAAVNIRVGGASVASVSVVPGAEIEFVLEYAVAFKTGIFVKFLAVAAAGAAQPQGMLGLAMHAEFSENYADRKDYLSVAG